MNHSAKRSIAREALDRDAALVVLVAAVCPGMTLPSVVPSRDDSADPGGVVWLRGASRGWLLATCESVLGAASC